MVEQEPSKLKTRGSIPPTRSNLLKHGVCHVRYNKQSVVQHIYGALEVYADVVIDPLR